MDDPRILNYARPPRSPGSAGHFRWDLVALTWSILASTPMACVVSAVPRPVREQLWPAIDQELWFLLFFAMPLGAFLFTWLLIIRFREISRSHPATLVAAWMISGLSLFVAALVVAAS